MQFAIKAGKFLGTFLRICKFQPEICTDIKKLNKSLIKFKCLLNKCNNDFKIYKTSFNSPATLQL